MNFPDPCLVSSNDLGTGLRTLFSYSQSWDLPLHCFDAFYTMKRTLFPHRDSQEQSDYNSVVVLLSRNMAKFILLYVLKLREMNRKRRE